MKNILKNMKISNKMTLYFCLLLITIGVVFYFILPTLLNYPPDTINTQFDKEVSVLYYCFQFLISFAFILILFVIYFKLKLSKIDKWEETKPTDKESILAKRKLCLSFPYKLYIILEIFPVLIVSLVLEFTGSHPMVLIFKIGILVFSFSTLLSSFFLIISKNVLYPVLKETSDLLSITEQKHGIRLTAKLIFQIFPSILVTALLIALIGYSRLTVEKGNFLNTYYRKVLDDAHLELNITGDPLEYIEDHVGSNFISPSDFLFIEYPDGTIYTTNGSELSHFFVKYMHELSPSHDNRVYEAYTIDAQGVIDTFEYNGQTYTVGYYYEIVSPSLIYYFLLSSGLLFLFNLVILFYITKSVTSDIQKITDGLNQIIKNEEQLNYTKLPITSNDELGDLAISFNNIQDLTKSNIEQIHNNQETLMESERLASLGQLIGGIAHNLKTPIMSISGALEGLTGLIKEYEESIDDPEVSSKDHHDIAKDMSDWISKIKDYTEYMSDIITAVKGQAVTLSEADSVHFTLDELVKRVNILMKHELKNAIIYLNISMKTDEHTSINGDINSLVQVINNMISNAIQAYNGETNKNIELILETKNNNVYISVKDYASGMPKAVQEKLFKEMITTKGKNGTGLGLYMSYSTIKAHFNGDIVFESEEGKGTTFTIIIPL